MNTVQPLPQFAALPEEEILAALNAYEALFEDEDDDSPITDEQAPTDPIVQEVMRLLGAYADRFEEYCEQTDDFPIELLEYEPESHIEKIAFEMFTDVLHDTLQEVEE